MTGQYVPAATIRLVHVQRVIVTQMTGQYAHVETMLPCLVPHAHVARKKHRLAHLAPNVKKYTHQSLAYLAKKFLQNAYQVSVRCQKTLLKSS
jgi:hypothetical protein